MSPRYKWESLFFTKKTKLFTSYPNVFRDSSNVWTSNLNWISTVHIFQASGFWFSLWWFCAIKKDSLHHFLVVSVCTVTLDIQTTNNKQTINTFIDVYPYLASVVFITGERSAHLIPAVRVPSLHVWTEVKLMTLRRQKQCFWANNTQIIVHTTQMCCSANLFREHRVSEQLMVFGFIPFETLVKVQKTLI